ncbi:MAG TPA: anti-sigma factor [Bacillales bacterium]|nr:anti-sigma factor [Bacillales bacterium]
MGRRCERMDEVIPFLAGTLDEKQTLRFLNHLSTCGACSRDLERLQDTWQALAFDFEMRQAPPSLKREVMDGIFDNVDVPRKRRVGPLLRRTFIAVASSLLLLFAGYVIYDREQAVEDPWQMAETIGASHVIGMYTLQPVNASAHGSGRAYRVSDGGQDKLVLTFRNMKPPKENEAYQVWLLTSSGHRWNCGTFRPNADGEGVLTYSLPHEFQFSGIGVTLESAPFEMQPHGKKVLKSS